MKKILAVFAAFGLMLTGYSQPCLHEGKGFYTQEDIDRFHSDYPNCRDIQGDVIISGSDITNLNGFSGVISVGGYLEISHTELLGNFSGLDSLVSIGGHFGIYSNLALYNLKGLDRLLSVGGNFEIFDNPILMNLKGLDTLATIAKNFWIGSNPALDTLKGLKNLSFIGGLLQINDNASLKGLKELINLKDIGAELVIYSNHSLQSLKGLDSIHPGMIPGIAFYGNDTLSICDVYSICKYFEVPWGSVTIHNNRVGCNNRAEVKAGCDTSAVETTEAGVPFIVYPNPTYKTLNIQTIESHYALNVSLLDITGREIFREVFTEPENSIDLSHWPGGVYFMRVTSGSRSFTEKVVKY